MRTCSLSIALLLSLAIPSFAPAEVQTLPARAEQGGDAGRQAAMRLPAVERVEETSVAFAAEQAGPQRLRISMFDMEDLIDRRIDEGVEFLNDSGARLTDRAPESSDSPGYAADWLRWRDSLEEMRSYYSWDEAGESRLNAEPPRPTTAALEAHSLIVREREALEQARERHRVELAEIRATGEAERWAIEAEQRERERSSSRSFGTATSRAYASRRFTPWIGTVPIGYPWGYPVRTPVIVKDCPVVEPPPVVVEAPQPRTRISVRR